jgi:hypothetical protein
MSGKQARLALARGCPRANAVRPYGRGKFSFVIIFEVVSPSPNLLQRGGKGNSCGALQETGDRNSSGASRRKDGPADCVHPTKTARRRETGAARRVSADSVGLGQKTRANDYSPLHTIAGRCLRRACLIPTPGALQESLSFFSVSLWSMVQVLPLTGATRRKHFRHLTSDS